MEKKEEEGNRTRRIAKEHTEKPITAIVCVNDVCVVYYEQIARINSI